MPRKKKSTAAPLPSLSPRKEGSIEKTVLEASLETSERNISEEMFVWMTEYRRIKALNERNTWLLADIAQEAAQKEGLFQLSRLADENYGTLKQYSFVSGQYSQDVRDMFPDLLFTHFRIVASREDRMVWLEKAQSEAWSTTQFAQELDRKDPLDEVMTLITEPLPEEAPVVNYPDEPKVLLSLDGALERMNQALLDGKLNGASILDVLNILFVEDGIVQFDSIETRFIKVQIG